MAVAKSEIRAIFDEAIALVADGDRVRYLDQVCGDDLQLRTRIEALLSAHSEAGGFFGGKSPAARVSQTCAFTESSGAVIGPYTLLEQIGEGGMGVVFMARQEAPVRRSVALKIIKPGMDSRQVIARFNAERQTLSLMDHPNIAKVLDAGTTESGRPYFVMELVQGQPITQYCDHNRLSPRQRLELFISVCKAIQHAHQKGIVHRDIKPSNVLVTLYDGKAVPKVIDFGVAKAMEQKLTEQTILTHYGTMVGTLEYMSPEQAEMSNLGVDTRSDIYSLGVLLYELLTGSTPLSHPQMKEAALGEILRLIKEEEPPKPSTRLSASPESLPSVSAQRQMEPAKLTKLVRGELDWIVMKALEKDRSRRYETADGFAADLHCYLADEPVQACPPSVGYRLRKFVRRNKVALATTALLVLMLLAAVGGVAGAIGWAVRNRTALEQQLAQDRATRHATMEKEIGRALDDTAASYQRDKLPEALAQVRRAEGLLAGGEAGAELSERVSRWRKAVVFASRLEEIPLERIVTDKGVMDWAASDRAYQQAFRDYGLDLRTLTPRAVADRIRPSVIRNRLIAALYDWSQCKTVGKLDGNEQLLEVIQQADRDPLTAAFRAAFKRKDSGALAQLAVDPRIGAQQAATVHLLAVMLGDSGQVPSAVKLLEESQQLHPADFWINYKLAFYLRRLDPPRYADAVSFYRVALSQRPDNALVHSALGQALSDAGKPAEAEAESRKALVLQPDGVLTHATLGDVLVRQRKWAEARAELERAVSINPEHAWPHAKLAWILANCPNPQFHELPRALEHAQKAAELLPNNRLDLNHLGAIQYRAGMWQQALQTLQKAEQMESTPDNYHRIYLVMANWRLGKKHEALKHWVQFVRWTESTRLDEPLYREELSNLRAEAEGLLGEYGDPETAYREIVRVEPNSGLAYHKLAESFARSGEWAKSAAAYIKALDLEEAIDLPTWLACACSLVQAGDTEGYRKLCDRMLNRFGQSGDVHQIAFLAHICVLAPNALADSGRVVQLAEQRSSMTADVEVHRLWSRHILGLAYYRAGQLEKAVATLEAGQIEPGLPSEIQASNWLALAMCRHRLGQDGAAAAALETARAILPSARPELGLETVIVQIPQILLHEAETVLREQ